MLVESPHVGSARASLPVERPGHLDNGALDASAGDAKWIGPGREDGPDPLPLLRREFDVPKPIRRAIVSVCGLGHYELRLNGEKVGDHVLDPGWTNYRKTCLYSTYDVTDQIRRGENCLARDARQRNVSLSGASDTGSSSVPSARPR